MGTPSIYIFGITFCNINFISIPTYALNDHAQHATFNVDILGDVMELFEICKDTWELVPVIVLE